MSTLITYLSSNALLVMTFVAVSFLSGSRLDAAPVGSTVTFETLTDAATTPTDDAVLAIDDPYELDNGVMLRFSFLDSETSLFEDPVVFEQRGAGLPPNGFVSTWGVESTDTGQPEFDSLLGDFFLSTPTAIGETGGEVAMRIDFETPAGLEMKFAAGEIWDIDAGVNGNEQWTVTAFNAADEVIDSVVSPLGIDQFINPAENPNQFDYRPWRFQLNTDESIAYILVEFVGTKERGVGLAFDNFTTAVVPEPISLVLLGSGLFVLAAWFGRRATAT